MLLPGGSSRASQADKLDPIGGPVVDDDQLVVVRAHRPRRRGVTTGPKISSRTTLVFGLVSTSTVGSMNQPGPSSFRPPVNALAPSANPDST
jgi:hypothetical protein